MKKDKIKEYANPGVLYEKIYNDSLDKLHPGIVEHTKAANRKFSKANTTAHDIAQKRSGMTEGSSVSRQIKRDNGRAMAFNKKATR